MGRTASVPRTRGDDPDADSMDMFVRATSGIDLDGLGPEAEWAFERRYGLLDPSDPLPPVPDEAETKALVERCGAIQARLADVCLRLDRCSPHARG